MMASCVNDRHFTKKMQTKINRKLKRLTGGGYTHNFVNEVDDFECTICSLVARDPKLIIECGHSFCATCLDDWIGSTEGPLLCPTDKTVFKDTDIAPDKRLERTIGSLHVYCDNRDNGCAETIELRDLQAHLAKCNYKPSRRYETLYMMVYRLAKQCEKNDKEIEELRSENNNLKETITNLTSKIENIRIDIRPHIPSELKYEMNNRTPCKWTITVENFMHDIWSPTFQTDEGYGMILMVCWQQSDLNLSIKCFLKSTFSIIDDRLRWPCKEDYSVTAIDTSTGFVLHRCQASGLGSHGRNRPRPGHKNDSPIYDGIVQYANPYEDFNEALTIVVKRED